MNRRQFLATTGHSATAATIAGLTSQLATAAPPAATRPGPFALPDAPALLNVLATEATIVLPVPSPATAWIEYGPTPSLGNRADCRTAGLLPYEERVVVLRLTDLRPGTTYHYRVHACPVDFRRAYSIKRGPEVASPTYSFRTLDPAAPTAKFTAWNDTHEIPETIAGLADALHAAPTDFLLWNGDVANEIESDDEILRHYVIAGGTASRGQVPLFFNRGNHDVRGSHARRLATYAAGPGNAFHYFFRHGPLAILVLDTGEDKPDSDKAYAGLAAFGHYREQQRQWLAHIIERPDFKSAPYRIAFAHIPLAWETDVPEAWPKLYGPNVRGWVCDDGAARWNDLLARAGVSLVISGHTHRPAFFPPTAERPYAQLVGGAQTPDRATVITGHADTTRLEVTMRLLSGTELARHRIPPIG